MTHLKPEAEAPAKRTEPIDDSVVGGLSSVNCRDREDSALQGAGDEVSAEPLDRSGAGEIDSGNPSSVGAARKPGASEHTSAGN